MVIIQRKARRSPSGARYKENRKLREYELGRQSSFTKLDKKRSQHIKTLGSNLKMRLLSIDIANVLDPKTKKFEKLTIKTITDNAANRHYVRRNIMTKGAMVLTEKGKAIITSRPGQDGTVNAVLI